MRGVLIRIVSALLLGIPVLLIVHVGSPAFEAMVAVSAAVLAWEWFGMCGNGRPDVVGILLGGVMLLGVGAAAVFGMGAALAILAAGACAVWLASRGERWLTLGVLYLGLPCAAVVWLRNAPGVGHDLVFWLMAVVWAADIGAYASGRLIGGPKLAPRISPNKTWAGLIGGVGLAALISAAFAAFGGHGTALLAPAALGLLLGLVSQAGDLGESWVKRRFGVKDASGLIPGHGGLLDRVDALMAGIVLVACMAAAGEGNVFRWL
jgi:phosphatidate cytidylyltransferase